MKILFITHDYPNYVPDLLLHGLRKILGEDVVDYPKKECLYQGVLGLGVCPENQLCPSWFPPDQGQIDRSDIQAKLSNNFFDLVICDIRSASIAQELTRGAKARLVIIDGEDHPIPIPPGDYVICRRETNGSDFSIPLPMGLPEEILHWIVSYDHLPKKYSIGFLGSTQDDQRRQIAETIATHYPDALLQATTVPSAHNPNPAGRFGRDDYYRSLQQCRLVLSLKGAGFDTFRFWENAACNSVHIADRFPLYIPSDFIDAVHLLRFSDLEELRRGIDQVLEKQIESSEIIIAGRHHLIENHLTTARARYFLDRIVRAYGS